MSEGFNRFDRDEKDGIRIEIPIIPKATPTPPPEEIEEETTVQNAEPEAIESEAPQVEETQPDLTKTKETSDKAETFVAEDSTESDQITVVDIEEPEQALTEQPAAEVQVADQATSFSLKKQDNPEALIRLAKRLAAEKQKSAEIASDRKVMFYLLSDGTSRPVDIYHLKDRLGRPPTIGDGLRAAELPTSGIMVTISRGTELIKTDDLTTLINISDRIGVATQSVGA